MSVMYEVLRQLDEWRHLPAYQLERRVDVLFGMFLPKVIEKAFGVCVDDVIPEFPLHKALLTDEPCDPSKASSHHSVNVDFAVFGHRGEVKRLLLVELKTDTESLNDKQLKNMKTAQCARSSKLLQGVISAAQHSQSKRKYAHLIWRLLELECLKLDNRAEFTNLCLEKDCTGLKPMYEKLRVGEDWCDACVEVVVISPEESNKLERYRRFNAMTFAQFADTLSITYKPFVPEDVRAFIAHVTNWARVRAGRVTPWPRES